MRPTYRHALAAVLAGGLATTAAFAQGDTPAMPDGPMGGMVQGNGMMPGGDMSGMMDMMRMMQVMGPMMEACTGMMQQMAHHQPGHSDGATPPAGHEATPAPQGG
jgi:hypothetical protein